MSQLLTGSSVKPDEVGRLGDHLIEAMHLIGERSAHSKGLEDLYTNSGLWVSFSDYNWPASLGARSDDAVYSWVCPYNFPDDIVITAAVLKTNRWQIMTAIWAAYRVLTFAWLWGTVEAD